jgi:hypothetical protein
MAPSAFFTGFTLLVAVLSSVGLASPLPPARPLNEAERSDLRYRLESLDNELELLVRNQRSDESGSARLDRAFEALRVLERIPLETGIDDLRAELAHRAKPSGVGLVRLEILARDKPKKPLPDSLFSDTPKFHLEPDQIAETLHLRLVISGDGPAIEEWIQKWPEDQLRLIEPEKGYARPGLRPAGNGRFRLQARVFRFRKIRFPRLKPRDPVSLLPAWARREPGRFAQAEPELWRYVRRIQERIPETQAPFEKKGELLLERARMSFFLSKAK